MSAKSDGNKKQASPLPWLRKSEQILWLVCLLVVLGAIVFSFYTQHKKSTRLIEIDDVPRRIPNFTVDVNKADWPELTVLPGISETYARRIVEFRAAHEAFQSIEDLQRVPGVGSKTIERLRPFLSVSSGSQSSDRIETIESLQLPR